MPPATFPKSNQRVPIPRRLEALRREREDLRRQANEYDRCFCRIELYRQRLEELVLGITLNSIWKEDFGDAGGPGWVDARRGRLSPKGLTGASSMS
jgi:hypothetical protein